MSLWIPLFTDFTSHPKTVKLRRALNIQTAEAFVIRLWLWCAEHYPNGFPDKEVLEEACLWKGKAGGLIEALTSVGFLDTSGELHGWSDRAGAHLVRIEEKRRADRARKSRGVPSEFHRKSHGTPSEVATQIEKENEKEKEKEKEREGDPSDLSGRPADAPGGSSSKSSADQEKRQRAEAIERVFAHYLTVWPKTSRYTLTPERRAKIAARLKSFSEDELKEALTKSGTDDWPDRPKHADIEKLLHNDGAVERWLNFTPKAQPVEKDPLDDGWMEWAAEQQRALYEPGPGESER